MIVVPMMLLSARTGRTSTLGKVVICNDGTGTEKLGHYTYTIYGKAGRKMAEGRVANFPRARRLAVDLLAEVLKEAKRGM